MLVENTEPTPNSGINRRKLEITPEPISGLPRSSLNLQTCETVDSIGLFARNFDLLIQKKSPNV